MEIARKILALTLAATSRSAPDIRPHLKHTAPGRLAPQVHNLPSRRHRRMVWKSENIAARSTGKITIKWHQTDLRHDGQHASPRA
jgi:hypothetical protein